MKVVIAAGGTGGHIFPALAVADRLRAEGVEIHWLGSRGRMEEQLVPKADYPISYLPIQAVRGKGWKTKLLFPIRTLHSVVKAWQILRKERADVVLGMGGYVCGPAGIAAWLSRKPFIIHEQNAIL